MITEPFCDEVTTLMVPALAIASPALAIKFDIISSMVLRVSGDGWQVIVRFQYKTDGFFSQGGLNIIDHLANNPVNIYGFIHCTGWP